MCALFAFASPKFFLSNGGCDLDGKMADAEQSNPGFKVSIQTKENPVFSVQPKIKIFVLINQARVLKTL